MIDPFFRWSPEGERIASGLADSFAGPDRTACWLMGGGPSLRSLPLGDIAASAIPVMGVNLAGVPKGVTDADFPPVSVLSEGGQPCDVHEMLSMLASNMETEERIFDELGFGPIRESWLKKAARLGEVITARTARDEIIGRFETVDEAGQLVLETPKGRVMIPAADIYF